MAEHRSVGAPCFSLLFKLILLLIVEGVWTFLAFGLGLKAGDAIGQSSAAGWAGAVVLLLCFGSAKAWFNLWLLRMEYRGELDLPVEVQLHNLVLPSSMLNAAVSGGTGPPEQVDSASGTANPRLPAGVGLGLPLLVVLALSASGNPYLVFLIPVVAYGGIHVVRRSWAGTVRPRPYHVGLALTLTHSVLPFALALAIVLFVGVLPALPAVSPYSVAYHFWYSPLHLVLLPLALLTVVYAATYCLLLAYDVHRARKGIHPEILREEGEPPTDGSSSATAEASTRTATDDAPSDGDISRLLWVFATTVPVNAIIVVLAYGFRPVAAVAAAAVPVLLLGVAWYVTDESIALGEPGTLAAGAAGGLVAGAIAYAVPLLFAPAGPYRYAVWLPVGALVGFVTGVLLHAAVRTGDGADADATARSG
jgi:MFS family permease